MIIQHCCQILQDQKLTVAFIESASSGYLSSQFSIYKNSGADILLGGLVCYDPSIKISILNIPQNLIDTYTAESMPVTSALAAHGKKLFKQANIIVACTGLLKPGGSATLDKPEGTFYIVISYLDRLYEYSFFLEGTPINRLNRLTELVARHLVQILSNKKVSL